MATPANSGYSTRGSSQVYILCLLSISLHDISPWRTSLVSFLIYILSIIETMIEGTKTSSAECMREEFAGPIITSVGTGKSKGEMRKKEEEEGEKELKEKLEETGENKGRGLLDKEKDGSEGDNNENMEGDKVGKETDKENKKNGAKKSSNNVKNNSAEKRDDGNGAKNDADVEKDEERYDNTMTANDSNVKIGDDKVKTDDNNAKNGNSKEHKKEEYTQTNEGTKSEEAIKRSLEPSTPEEKRETQKKTETPKNQTRSSTDNAKNTPIAGEMEWEALPPAKVEGEGNVFIDANPEMSTAEKEVDMENARGGVTLEP